MVQLNGLPWERIHEFLLDSGSIRNPRELCIDVIRKIHVLIPYNQARLYFINDNGKIYDEVLFGVDKRWSRAYLDYFSQIENGRYNIENPMPDTRYPLGFKGNLRDWTCSERDEFITDYIKPQGLNYSLGFVFQDANNMTKCVCSLDRTNSNGYTPHEIATLSVIQSHLENLHKNLFVLSLSNSNYQKNIGAEAELTPREAEITSLLCDGITPANIGKKLSLSISTVYRHIANIHTKLQVSNRQELIVKLLHGGDNSKK